MVGLGLPLNLRRIGFASAARPYSVAQSIGGSVTKDQIRGEHDRLQGLLEAYEACAVTTRSRAKSVRANAPPRSAAPASSSASAPSAKAPAKPHAPAAAQCPSPKPPIAPPEAGARSRSGSPFS